MPWRPKVPSPTWRSFLRNHLPEIVAIDMFVAATATFHLLYALIVLSLDRRRVVHFAVTSNPTQYWLSGQVTEAFPWDTAPRYLLRDRDKSYGPAFRHRVRAMGITEVVTAPRSPWQNPYAERLIGSIRRECLDHVIILNERHLRRVLSSYFRYHHDTRTHLSLGKDCPRPRRVQLPSTGKIIGFPEVGGCTIATSVEPLRLHFLAAYPSTAVTLILRFLSKDSVVGRARRQLCWWRTTIRRSARSTLQPIKNGETPSIPWGKATTTSNI
jgi:hypothetical protein